ncbi:MAG: TonB family protein [Maribacter sp.]|jgi:TonB family protein
MNRAYFFIAFCAFFFFQGTVSAQEEEVFKIVEEMPYFGECSEHEVKEQRKQCSDATIMSFIFQNVYYPEQAVIDSTEGTVVIRFTVEKDGTVTNHEILRDIGNGCGDAALEVMKQMPNWMPGKQNGEKVRVQFTLPVKFKLAPPVQTERFAVLNDLFCADYLTDFVAVDVIKGMANDELQKDNICAIGSIKNELLRLKLTLIHNDIPKSIESEDGNFTPAMKEILANVVSGDVIELDYKMNIGLNEENTITKEAYKSVIVE